MQLKPITQLADAHYPKPSRDLRLKVVKGLAAFCATAALGLVACWESPFVHEERLAGVMPVTYFECSNEAPIPKNVVDMSSLVGSLCGEETAWASIEISEAQTLRFELATGADWVIVSILAPGGIEAGELSDDELNIELEVTPGIWTFAVNAIDPFDNGYFYFEILASIAE